VKQIAVWIAASFVACAGPVHAADIESNPMKPAHVASQPVAPGSPAVQAAEQTRMAGDMPPQKRTVPQVNVPLKRKGTPDAHNDTVAPSAGVNDERASCLAVKNKRERASCSKAAAALNGQPTPKR